MVEALDKAEECDGISRMTDRKMPDLLLEMERWDLLRCSRYFRREITRN